MPEYLAPGVYVEEISGPRTIAGVSTSSAGFVGEATQGPLHEAVHVTSFSDFERTHGGLRQSADLGYAVQQFFLNGGSDAWIVRVESEAHAMEALRAFDAVEPLGLLCLPGYATHETLTAALAYCDRRRTFLIADP